MAEKLLRPLPHSALTLLERVQLGRIPAQHIRELEQARQKIVREAFRALPWQQRWEVVDRDNRKRWVTFSRADVHCGLIERRVDIINRQGVVRVGGIAGDVDDDAEPSLGASGLDCGLVEEGGGILEVR